MKKTISYLVLLALALLAITGCTAEVSEDTTGEVFTIVSTVPSITEILFEIGAGEQIIGVDNYSDYPEAANSIDKVGDFNGFDIERVISLDPDIVFAGNTLQATQIEQLLSAGVNVLSLEPTYYDDIRTSIIAVGDAINMAEAAQQLASSIDQRVQDIQTKTESIATKPTVYYVMGIGEYGNWTSGRGSFINTLMEYAGGECITKDSQVEWVNYPLEDLLIADPDVLVVSAEVDMDDLLSDPVYSELSAVVDGRIISINPDIIERPGPRIVEAIQVLYDGFEGE